MRSPLINFLIILTIFASPIAHADAVRILVQSSPLAGFKYYAGEALCIDARIAKLRNRLSAQGNPWQRLLVDVFVVL